MTEIPTIVSLREDVAFWKLRAESAYAVTLAQRNLIKALEVALGLRNADLDTQQFS